MNDAMELSRTLGFQDGFAGRAARGLLVGHDEYTAYLDAYRDGKNHRAQVEEVLREENTTMESLFRKCFQHYYDTVVLPRRQP